MEFDTWAPVYERILADFGFGGAADDRARDVLADLTTPFDHSRIDLAGDTVAVAGAGPSLPDETDVATTADTVVAASTAAEVLRAADVPVDYVVTDLDGSPATVRELTEQGVVALVHAHGDNIPAVEEHVPSLAPEAVLPTTQGEPAGPVENFGGFTDGDRAAFFADHFGAGELVFPGWDFDDTDVDEMKRHKLRWAERLLYWLERRRDERFDVLDGRREAIDTTDIPPFGADV